MVIRGLVVSTVDRVEMLRTFLLSVLAYFPHRMTLVLQGYDPEDVQTLPYRGLDDVILLRDRVGAGPARLHALDAFPEVDTWITFDDDMILLPETRYGPAIEWSLEPGVGLVSTGWVQHPNHLRRRPIVDAWIKQAIVYTGGGMVVSRTAREKILAAPRRPWRFDNPAWALATYLAGLENWRWRGSVAVHCACKKGGRLAWLKAEGADAELPPAEYLTVRKAKGWGWCIPSDADLTPLARVTHLQARPIALALAGVEG